MKPTVVKFSDHMRTVSMRIKDRRLMFKITGPGLEYLLQNTMQPQGHGLVELQIGASTTE